MQVVRPKDWLALSTLGSLIAIALLWSVFGRIPVTASGRGILVYPRRIATVESPVAGQLNAINVNPGDCVEPGDILATLEPTELIQKQQLAQAKLEQLRQQNREATTLSSDRLQDELAARQTRLQQEILQANVSRQNDIRDLEREIAQLQTQIQQRSTIKSPHPGCLLELTVKSGQWVQSGTSLGTLRLVQSGSQLVAVTYFAIADGKRIQPGMTVRVTPATVKRERFGGIIGSVTSISEFPVTPEGATSVVGISQLAQDLLASEPKIEVFAQLQRNPANFSGYTWSSSQGPPSLKISPGTTTEVRVTVERRAPITFILPILRRWFG